MNTSKDRRPKNRPDRRSINQPFAVLDQSVPVNQTRFNNGPVQRHLSPTERRRHLMDSRCATVRMPVVRGLNGVFMMPFSGVLRNDGKLSINELVNPKSLEKPMAAACRMGMYMRAIQRQGDQHCVGILYVTPTMTRVQLTDPSSGKARLTTLMPPVVSTEAGILEQLKLVTGVDFGGGRFVTMPTSKSTCEEVDALLDSVTKAEIPALVHLGFEKEAQALEAMLVDDAALASLEAAGAEVCQIAAQTTGYVVTANGRAPEPLYITKLPKEVVLTLPETLETELKATASEIEVVDEAPAAELDARANEIDQTIPESANKLATGEEFFWEELMSSPNAHHPDTIATRVMDHYAEGFGIDSADLGDQHAKHLPELAAAMQHFGLLVDAEAIQAADRAVLFPRTVHLFSTSTTAS